MKMKSSKIGIEKPRSVKIYGRFLIYSKIGIEKFHDPISIKIFTNKYGNEGRFEPEQ